MTTPALKQSSAVSKSAPPARSGRAQLPSVDIYETKEEILLSADMPGVKSDDIDIHFENGELSIYGPVEPRHTGKRWLYSEYGAGSFSRRAAPTRLRSEQRARPP